MTERNEELDGVAICEMLQVALRFFGCRAVCAAIIATIPAIAKLAGKTEEQVLEDFRQIIILEKSKDGKQQ